MFKNKNVLVAGGNGLIGKQLVPLLTDRGANVKVVDKNIDPDITHIGASTILPLLK